MDIIIAGVGGQGTVLASRALAQAAVAAGLDAITSETIGMAQREGVVQSHVRIGAGEAGPLIPDGAAELLIGFEPAEAARALPKVKPGARAAINTAVVYPFTVALGASKYDPGTILSYLERTFPGAVMFDATALAVEAGSRRAMNAVMLGAVAGLGLLPVPAEGVLAALLRMVRPAYRELNERAFALGRGAVRKAGTA
ncbi:MAG: indolepyruvate oxidoreductase subunit beta [Bacteroidota bacterium]